MHEVTKRDIGAEQQCFHGIYFKAEGIKGQETYAKTRKCWFAKYGGDEFVARTLDTTVKEGQFSLNFMLNSEVYIRMSAVNVI